MARLRKAARIWRNPAARDAARRVTVAGDDRVFAIDLPALFMRAAPLEVELGAGLGDFVIERAGAAPERNFIAVELASPVARMLAVRIGRLDLPNVKVMHADARTVVNLLMPDSSVAAYHIYFPDPWPKERHAKHRMFTPGFVASLRRTLKPGGRVYLATDVRDWADAMFAMMAQAGFKRLDEPPPGRRRSAFWRKYAEAGKEIFSSAFSAPQGRT